MKLGIQLGLKLVQLLKIGRAEMDAARSVSQNTGSLHSKVLFRDVIWLLHDGFKQEPVVIIHTRNMV